MGNNAIYNYCRENPCSPESLLPAIREKVEKIYPSRVLLLAVEDCDVSD